MNYVYFLARKLGLALVAAGLCAAATVHAQGGPPMVTDDPATPGDGHWEINVGSIGSRGSGGWLIAVADADINYGWGDRIQLKFDTPWNIAQGNGDWTNGLGTSLLGLKWRFLDDDAGWNLSTYPQVGFNLDSSSVGRGVASPGRSLFLPLEAARHLGPVDIDLELGRSLVQQGQNEWVAGAIVAHTFAEGREAMFEARVRVSPAATVTLANAGARWRLSETATLLVSAGREFGPAAADPARCIYYLGVQFQR